LGEEPFFINRRLTVFTCGLPGIIITLHSGGWADGDLMILAIKALEPRKAGKGVMKPPCRYQLRPKTGTPYHLCPEKEVEAALDLAAIRIPHPQSTVSVAGRTYTFFPDETITPEKEKILLDFLTYCGEFELVKIPG
jgi:hypothetical protein